MKVETTTDGPGGNLFQKINLMYQKTRPHHIHTKLKLRYFNNINNKIKEILRKFDFWYKSF